MNEYKSKISNKTNYGSNFAFFPANAEGEGIKNCPAVFIEEDDMQKYLAYFIIPKYDPSLPENQLKAKNFADTENFEWNLDPNYYTRERMNEILRDIEQFIKDVQTPDFIIRKSYPPIQSNNYITFDVSNLASASEKEESLLFYREFIDSMRAILNSNDECRFIIICGP